ncbi:50S ribosomal protein L10 [Deinococcota bacterium DY0809b]
MPSERNVQLLERLKEMLQQTNGSFFLVNYQGLDANEEFQLRRQVTQAGGRIFVAKNTLIRIAVRDLELPEVDEVLKGPSAVVIYDEPVAVAKALVQFAKENSKEIPQIKAGFLQGQKLAPEEVKAIAELPTLDELRAELVGVLQAPMSELVGVLEGAQREFAGLLDAYVSKQEAA